jgi:GNAT superfamily N-acetyltransferase
MKSQRIPMTLDEFHRMPRELGWKHEYWEGQAQISPQHLSVVTTTVTVEPRPMVALRNPPYEVRPVTEADLPQMIPTYFEAFEDTIDYCDWDPARIKIAAKDNLESFFAGDRGRPLPASHMAVTATEVVGAMLIVEKWNGQPLVDLLFVTPTWHHQGIATALGVAALDALYKAGYQRLTSRFLLGNAASRTWHHRFGFVDEPDLFIARAYYSHTQHAVERHQEMGDLNPIDYAALVAVRDHWDQQIEALEAIAAEEGIEVVLSIL